MGGAAPPLSMSHCMTSRTVGQYATSSSDAVSTVPPDLHRLSSSLVQAEVGSGVALFELSPVFVSPPEQGADLVAAHHYDDSQQLLVVVSAGRLWLNYQVGRCQPYVKSFALPDPNSCAALELAPDGARMVLIGMEVVHLVDVDQAIRSPHIDFACLHLKAPVKPGICCWWRDDAGRDQLVLGQRQSGALVIDVELMRQDAVELEMEIGELQSSHGLVHSLVLLQDVDGAYHWLDGHKALGLARFRKGVRIRLQAHHHEGPVWSVYTPSRSMLEIFRLDLKGSPLSTHLVPESDQHVLFDNYIFCVSADKIEIVSLILSETNFEFGSDFNIVLSVMQTIPTAQPLQVHVIGEFIARPAHDHPPILLWSTTVVRRVFRSSTIIDLVEIVVSAFVHRSGEAPLPSPTQISLLALSLRLDPADFFEFAGDRAWNVERDFVVAFEFYNRSNLAFHKLVRLCMDASRHCDIIQVVEDVLARRTTLSAKNRCELAHCQFFCLLYSYMDSGDDVRLLEFARRSKDLNLRRSLDSLRTTNDHDLMLRFCCEHDLVDDYLKMRCEGSGRPLTSAEVDVIIKSGHRRALLANQIAFLALDADDQLRLVVDAVDTVPQLLWPALVSLPFRISSASLLSLFRELMPVSPMLPVYILSALRLLETSPGHLDQDVFTRCLQEWRADADYPKLIEVCLAQHPPMRQGAALLLECNQDQCEAAVTRLSAASDSFAHETFVQLLMGELRKLQSVEEKSLLMLLAQQIWQQKSTAPFESAIEAFVGELAPVILYQPSPWVTSRLFLQALASLEDVKVFERDDYEGALHRVLESPALMQTLTGARSVTFPLRHDSPPLPYACGQRHDHHC